MISFQYNGKSVKYSQLVQMTSLVMISLMFHMEHRKTSLLTFDKTVILEVSRMGTINLALRTDVYCIIFQSLEVLSRLKTCFFYAMDA